MTIDIAESSSLTVAGTSKIVVQDYLVFVSDGQVIARLDAQFDFANLPPHLHAFTLNHLLRRRSSFDMPLAPLPAPIPPATSAAAVVSTAKETLWTRIWRTLKNK